MLFGLSKKTLEDTLWPLLKMGYANFKDTAKRTKIEMLLPDNDPPYLKNRVIWCYNCGTKRQLTTTHITSQVVCNSCYGTNWEHFTNKYFVPYSITIINNTTGKRTAIPL